MDILSGEVIFGNLKNKDDCCIEIFDEIPSTNTYLKEVAKKGFLKNTIVIAKSQTDGKGRLKRRFFSPKDTGIYMSILSKPSLCASQSVLITAAAGVAVSEAIEVVCNKTPKIKWVNDLILDNKKICGILCEGAISSKSGMFDYTVLGIGINLYKPENNFDEEIKDIAGYVTETYTQGLKNRLVSEIINRYFYYTNNLENKEFLEKYKKLSCVLGKEITVMKQNPTKALALDIDDACRLKVKYPNGKTEYLSSGEISIKY